MTDERFESLDELRDRHDELMAEAARRRGEREFLEEVGGFVNRASRTGAILPWREERAIARSILIFWSARLSGFQDTHPINLADYAPGALSRVCPYPGLEAFEAKDAGVFRGRDRLIEAIFERLNEELDGTRCVAIRGPAGSGRTSLLQAGILAQIATRFPGYAVAGPFTPGAAAIDSLENALQTVRAGKMVIAVDRLWEIAGRSATERVHFEHRLLNLLEDAETLLIAVVSPETEAALLDAMPKLAARLFAAQVTLTPMDAAELRQAIVEPAAKRAVRFEPGLVERMMNDALTMPNSLPLLTYTLRRLWTGDDCITAGAYDEMGGLGRVLARNARELQTSLPEEDRKVVWSILRCLNQPRAADREPGVGGRVQRVLASMLRSDEASELPVRRSRKELHRLADSRDVDRLLTELHAAGVVRVSRSDFAPLDEFEITHASLLGEWPDLRTLVEQDKLTAQRARQRRARFLQLAPWAAVLILILVLAPMAWFGARRERQVDSRNLAQASIEEKNAERSLLWAFQAENMSATPEAGAALERALAFPHASAVLFRYNFSERTGHGHCDIVTSLVFRGDRLVLSSSADGHIYQWDTREIGVRYGFKELDPSPLAGWPDPAECPSADAAKQPSAPLLMSISQDKKTLAVARVRGDLRLVPEQSGERPNVTDVTAVAFIGNRALAGTFDGHLYQGGEKIPQWTHTRAISAVASLEPRPGKEGRIATVGLDGVIKLADLPMGRDFTPRIIEPQVGPLYSVAFNAANGDELAAAGIAGTIAVYKLKASGYTAPRMLSGFSGPVRALEFSPNGSYLAAGAGGKSVQIFDRDESGAWERKYVLTGLEGNVLSLAFSPDGSQLVAGGEDGTARVWDVPSGFDPGNQRFATPADRSNEALGLSYSPDSKFLAVAHRKGEVDILKADSAGLLREAERRIVSSGWAVALGPEGREIATASTIEKEQRSIFAPDWQEVTRSPDNALRHDPRIVAITVSPESRWLAYALRYGQVPPGAPPQYVKVRNLNQPATGGLDLDLKPPGAPSLDDFYDLAFSPNGEHLAVSQGRWVRIWNLDRSAKRWTEGCMGARHSAQVRSVRFTPDGSRLVSGGMDGTIKLWDLGCRVLHSVGSGFSAQVSGIAVSPLTQGEGIRVVATEEISPGSVSEFVVDSDRDHLNALPVSPSFTVGVGLNRASFSPDGQYLAITTNDGRAIEYAVDLSNLAGAAERRVRNPIGADCAKHPLMPYGICQGLGLVFPPRAENWGASPENQNRRFTWAGRQVDEADSAIKRYPSDYENPVSALEDVQLRAPGYPIYSIQWNDLCWYASTIEKVVDVMEACDAAVALNVGDPFVRDARGVARARFGKFKLAAEDFEAFRKTPEGADYNCLRLRWLRSLEQNRNPFADTKEFENITKTDVRAGCTVSP